MTDLRTIPALRSAYASGLSPVAVVAAIRDDIAARGDDGVWISLSDTALEEAAALDPTDRDRLPLWGIPFAVKDNIDVAGKVTTAACPSFAYTASHSAGAVAALVDAGAILIGKTNLDQFATGLNGTRSPYGAVGSHHDPTLIAGGSSSGSAVAVAAGLVAFALGTDTAGSGRVPAALNGVVGLKPSVGSVSTRGVVPACRSLDCVSVFAPRVDDAVAVRRVIARYDAQDPWSSRPGTRPSIRPAGRRLAVPAIVEGWGDRGERDAWDRTLTRFVRAGFELVEVDVAPLLEAGRHLYGGAWLAERAHAVGAVLGGDAPDVDPVVREILGRADDLTPQQVWASLHRAAEIRRWADDLWDEVDALLTPTVTTTFTIDAMRADPIDLNAALGTYTTFTNILGMCAIAVPAGMTDTGVPFGVTLHGPDGDDERVADFASALEALGDEETMDIAVVGAHLRGLPLHHQIEDRGGVLVRRTTTANRYRLFALAEDEPRRPGLITDLVAGAKVEVEVYRLPVATVGSFLRGIAAPLGIGTLDLDDGTTVQGFVCDPARLGDARDITEFGGWRAYLAATR